jgi:hypothetical protein
MGVCLLVHDPDVMARRPELVWPVTGLMYAGYTPDGEQVRVRWLGPGDSVADTALAGEVIVPLDEAAHVSRQDVLDLWRSEAGITTDEAQRRIDEALLVATFDGRLVGVATAYLRYDFRLRTDLWFLRVFVSSSHRGGNVAVQLTLRTWDELLRRREAGDPRGSGLCAEIEHEGLRRHLPEGLWATTRLVLVGDNHRGDHVRVRWFPDATAPTPSSEAGQSTVEVVRDSVRGDLAGEILDFWRTHGALSPDAARARLAQVVCVLRDRHGAVRGVNSVQPAVLDRVGRTLFHYRRFLATADPDADRAMLQAAVDTLEARTTGGPVQGICMRLAPAELSRWPADATWPGTGMSYIGYEPDGHQLRLRYFGFTHFRVPEDQWALPAGYRVEPLPTSPAGADDVVDLWLREHAVAPEWVERRVREILLVATGPDGEVAGVMTAYLQRSEQLGMDLWFARAYVGRGHRLANLSAVLGMEGWRLLEQRYVDGTDRRGLGVGSEVENPELQIRLVEPVWPLLAANHIGSNRRREPVWVRFFPGAPAPPPPS